MDGEQLWTVKEVADRLRVGPVTIQRWLRSGKMKGLRLGGARLGWRIPESEVARLIQTALGAGGGGVIESDTYVCARCGETFEKEVTDAEAWAEVAANGWGDMPKEELDIVCDDCYEYMTSRVPPPSWPQH